MVSSSLIRNLLNRIAIFPVKHVMHLAKSRRNEAPPNGALRLTIVFLIPPLLLLIDYYFYPIIYSTNVENDGLDVNLNTLLVERTMRLGTYQAHDIHASIDDIRDTRYLDFLNAQSNALIISAFISDDKERGLSGALQNAVLYRLQTAAPNDYVAIKQRFKQMKKFTPGQVVDISLHIPPEQYGRFPLNELLIVALPQGRPDPDHVEAGLRRALTIADRKNITNVVIPFVGTRWNDHGNGSLSLSIFFNAFFRSIPLASGKEPLYLSFYYNSPTYQLEDAVRALNATWQQILTDAGESHKLYRVDIRIIILFLELCFVVCSFFIQLTAKNVLIVALAFGGLAYGSKTWVDMLIQTNEGAAFSVKLLVFAVISSCFPLIVTWNPKDIFTPRSESRREET
jgi:hypothetical protein